MRKYLFLAVVGACALSTAAFADTITAGQAGQPPDVLSLTGQTFLQAASGTMVAQTFTANYNAAVYSGNDTFCPTTSCLTFAYQISNIAAAGTGDGIIEMLTASLFTGFSTDVGYTVLTTAQNGFLTSGVTPNTVGRSAVGPGAVVDFDYPNMTGGTHNLQPGAGTNQTAVLLIETNATTYSAGLFAAIDGSTSTVAAFEPTATTTTPEPNSLALAGLGLLGFSLLLKRVRRQA